MMGQCSPSAQWILNWCVLPCPRTRPVKTHTSLRGTGSGGLITCRGLSSMVVRCVPGTDTDLVLVSTRHDDTADLPPMGKSMVPSLSSGDPSTIAMYLV